MPQDIAIRKEFLEENQSRSLLWATGVLALVYFMVLTFYFPVGSRVLFGVLVAGEIFHMWQVFTFIFMVRDTRRVEPIDPEYQAPVDVFITVAGEPVEVVEATVTAALRMRTVESHVYILNDGYVAKKENWMDMEHLARRLGVTCITRRVAGGAKAGNINNALRRTRSPLIAMFDADHVPKEDFLEKTVPYFSNPLMGFVQTPQFYRNYAQNYITKSSWEQQEIFFGPICRGKNRDNAATMCGTNMVVRREALLSVGGMCTESIAEDFITGLFMHNVGYHSVYVPEVLAEGLATEDLLTYSKQQFRWARGALDVIFRYNPIFMRGLTRAQKVQYLASASFYFTGLVVVIDALLPIAYFYTGQVPVLVSGMLLAGVFLPYFFVVLYLIQRVSNYTFTFASLSFSMGSFAIQLKALYAAITFKRSSFDITSKFKAQGNFLPLAKWHLFYIALVVVGIPIALSREGLSASLVNNTAWALFNIAIFAPFIYATLPESEEEPAVAPPALRKLATNP